MRIRFGEPISLEVPVEHLPPESLATEINSQIPSQDQFRVYIVFDVYRQIWEHVNKTPTIECGGILVGHPFRDEKKGITFVIIVSAIPQNSENSSVAHFTVGPAEIAEARAEMEREYPGLIVVGWYHSHPGHGIFLSGQDMTIVRSIYNEDWHVALVIDPKQRVEGIFIGPDGTPIGGRGNHPLRSTWFPLKSEPDSVKAIALYNQIKEAIRDQHRQQTLETIKRLEELLEKSDQLKHWGYRDLNALKSGFLAEEEVVSPDSDPFSRANPPVVTSEPARDKKKRATPNAWTLGASLISTAVFTVFFIFAVIGYSEEADSLMVLGVGAMLSLITLVTAVYLIVSRTLITETVVGVTLISITLLVWMGFAFFQSNKFSVLAFTTETPTSMPRVEPLLQSTPTREVIKTPPLSHLSPPTLRPTVAEEMSETILPPVPLITDTITFTPVFSESVSPILTISPTITVTNPNVP